MKKIQVIGLPGSGKTTGITNYLRTVERDLVHLDIASFSFCNKESKFLKAVKQNTSQVIAESACGVNSPIYTVRLKVPIQKVYEQLLQRDGTLDEDYLSLLSTQMVRADYTIGSAEDLPDLLRALLEE